MKDGVLWVVELDYSHNGDWCDWRAYPPRREAREAYADCRDRYPRQPWRIRKYVREEPKR